MCGIVGYIGTKKASPILINGLLRLEYRGYDSAGIATIENDKISIMKDKGRVKNLYNLPGIGDLKGTIGIAHTRWATHGKPSKERVKAAIRVSQAEEFVSKLDDKEKAHIAQGGTNVSGGQKQRLSIARTIARDPEIYIFDDSFSALDYKTDSTLRSELKKYTKDATVMIVAQRIGTILNADKIVVLDNGKCVGIGTHKELMKKCKVYKEIALSQVSKEELENV